MAKLNDLTTKDVNGKADSRRVSELDGDAKNIMTAPKWKEFIRLTANGMDRRSVIKALKITRQTYESHLISSPEASKQLNDAVKAWIRRAWPMEKIEEIMAYIASGKTLQGACELMGIFGEEITSLSRIFLTDPSIREMYDEARELQAEVWADDTIDIADHGREDTYTETLKDGTVITRTNHEVVKRSDLRVKSRQWVISRTHHARFGDKLKQEVEANVVVDHIEDLRKARLRKEKAFKEGKKTAKKWAVSSPPGTIVPPTQTKH